MVVTQNPKPSTLNTLRLPGSRGPAPTTSPVVVNSDTVTAETDRRNKAIRVPTMGLIVSSPESANASEGNPVSLGDVSSIITEAQAQNDPEYGSQHDDISMPPSTIDLVAATLVREVDKLPSGLSIGALCEDWLNITEPAQADLDDEQSLSLEVERLWLSERRQDGLVEKRSARLASLRLELGGKLAKLKAILCRQGRKGQWKAFLEARAIPRATADIYVKRFERSSREPQTSVPRAQPQPPSAKDMKAKAIKAAKTLAPFLQTLTLVELYLDELRTALLEAIKEDK